MHGQLKAHPDESKGHLIETLCLIGKCAVGGNWKDSIIANTLATQASQVW